VAKKKTANLLPKLTETEQDLLSHIQDGFQLETDSLGGNPVLRRFENGIGKEIRMESTISTKDLKAKLDRKDPVKIVETLALERYREAHLPGALNIPPEQIKELAPQLLPNKDAEIVTYCTSTH
jgi:hypothetical protein